MAIDAKGYLSGGLSGLTNMYQADIRAIPEEQWLATHGGVTRSASEATADAIGLLNWTTEALKGNVIVADGSLITDEIKSACSTRDGASAALSGAAQAFSAALAATSDDALNTPVTPPWRMDTPLYMLAEIAVSHLWYHDGQLNYIQSLLGDDKVHWMG